MDADQRARLVENIVASLNPVSRDIQLRQLRHFHAADPAYGAAVAAGVGVELEQALQASAAE